MKAKSTKEIGFVEICTQKRREKLAHHFLYKIDKSVDWGKLRKTITKRYKKKLDSTDKCNNSVRGIKHPKLRSQS